MHKDPVGRVENPVTNLFPGFGDYQTTLPSYSAPELSRKALLETEDWLRQEYGVAEGVAFAANYGSEVSKLMLPPDSLSVLGSREEGKGSDIDLLVVLGEDVPDEAAWEVEERLGSCRDESSFPSTRIDASVYTYSEFMDQTRESRRKHDDIKGLAYETFEVNQPGYKDFSSNYVTRSRAFLTGHMPIVGFEDKDVMRELDWMENLVESGEPKERIRPWYELKSRSPSHYRERIERLEENHRLGRALLQLRNSNGKEIPRLSRKEERELVGQLEPGDMTVEELADELEESVTGKRSSPSTVTSQGELGDFR